MKKNNNVFLIILFGIVILTIFLLPNIYTLVENIKLPKIQANNNIKKEENKLDEDVLENLHFPIMRSDITNQFTYYQVDKFTIDHMSSEDILYNAFLDIYEGNIKDYNGYFECTKTPKVLNSEFIKLRINNILGKNVNYTLKDFYVYDNSEFKGNWIYDSSSSNFIYTGSCANNDSEFKYYDLEEFIKTDSDNQDIIVYYYVGFAKVDRNNNYIIYSDSNMTSEIKKGILKEEDTLYDIFKNINKKYKKIYKYTFKNTICSYEEYCLYRGEWVDEF